ncbi:MAG: hypothetical protein AB9903_13980 [Vulcanimicrobiota bacterium]
MNQVKNVMFHSSYSSSGRKNLIGIPAPFREPLSSARMSIRNVSAGSALWGMVQISRALDRASSLWHGLQEPHEQPVLLAWERFEGISVEQAAETAHKEDGPLRRLSVCEPAMPAHLAASP